SIDQAVIAADANGRVTVFNRAAERLFGRTRDTDSDPTVDSLIGEDSYKLRDVASGHDPVHEHEHELKKGDRPRQLVFSTTPVATGQGVLEGAVSIVRDETETREMEEQMRRSQRLSEMGNLAAGVAHEIRNPLNAIGLAAQRLQMEVTDPDARKIAATVLEETRRLNVIVEDFLSLARPSTQPVETVNVSELVTSVASMARFDAEQQGVVWSEMIADDVIVRGISDDLRKALWNVITNAIAATPRDCGVAIRLETRGTDALVSVHDEGSGIAPELIDRVFQPYFTTKDHGTGLGLAITHRIVSDHDGTIRIDSPPSGADTGTMVTITLPLVPADEWNGVS
ncbi:MAG: PAS domain-containing protein, partial [candidate division Zixibacteria bacterium]|nr:PAS domain-containing protein [candidate division Zixibacteria bacterium]